jgi:hypothetical protein
MGSARPSRKISHKAGRHLVVCPAAPLRTDVHQHLWPAELLDALAARSEPPFARRDGDSWLLHVPAEPPSPIVAQEPEARAAALAGHGVDRALLSLSTALEVERLAPDAIAAVSTVVGARQIVHGSDIPVLHAGAPSDDARVRENPARLLA